MIDWKVNRDPYYSSLYHIKKWSFSELEEAGYFEDTSTDNYDILESLSVLCTPFNFLKKDIDVSKKHCVIINTGSFCPIHDGHIETMIHAKKALEDNGYEVLGGYISPGHDEYIFSKVKENQIPAFKRLQIINDAIKEYPWLSVDPWESMFCKVAVNFTDVIFRLQEYLKLHLSINIEVIFVCGSDNARFALTFNRMGKCVVVSRPGYEDRFEKYKIHPNVKNTLFVDGYNDNSSTKVRNTFKFEIKKKDLNLRTNRSDNETHVINALGKYFGWIKLNYISIQKQKFNTFTQENIISLDSEIKSNHNLAISRLYDLYGSNKLGYINRPGTLPLKEQIDQIDLIQAFLFDDDIHTGNTIKYVTKLLSSKLVVDGCIILNTFKDSDEEVLDCRDFLLDNENNGLVVNLGDTTYRVPYVYPYVCPYIRASVTNPVEFSIKIWELNKRLFGDQKLKEFKHLNIFRYKSFEFTEESTIEEICNWHLKLIRSTNKN